MCTIEVHVLCCWCTDTRQLLRANRERGVSKEAQPSTQLQLILLVLLPSSLVGLTDKIELGLSDQVVELLAKSAAAIVSTKGQRAPVSEWPAFCGVGTVHHSASDVFIGTVVRGGSRECSQDKGNLCERAREPF